MRPYGLSGPGAKTLMTIARQIAIKKAMRIGEIAAMAQAKLTGPFRWRKTKSVFSCFFFTRILKWNSLNPSTILNLALSVSKVSRRDQLGMMNQAYLLAFFGTRKGQDSRKFWMESLDIVGHGSQYFKFSNSNRWTHQIFRSLRSIMLVASVNIFHILRISFWKLKQEHARDFYKPFNWYRFHLSIRGPIYISKNHHHTMLAVNFDGC